MEERDLKSAIARSAHSVVAAASILLQPHAAQFMAQTAQDIAACFQRGNKIVIAGNGGSLCDAAHFAEELTGYFRHKRPALPALVLSDASHITCCANDTSFEQIFQRAIEAFGKEGDIFIALSTSGNSLNLIAALECAQRMNLSTISFLGKNGGGKMAPLSDSYFLVEGFAYSDRIQEVHMAAIHIIIEMVEYILGYAEYTSQI